MTLHPLQRRGPAPAALVCLLTAGGAWAQAEGALAATAATAPEPLAPVTVTGTRERKLLAETPASVGLIRKDEIDAVGPMHPQQLLGQVPGVAIAVTNGEGHTTAIRQPYTTSPLYLFLEDGIPVRATGFFNHNALYELNLPQAGGVEVVRGPGTALYGSDAIGGTINVLSRDPSDQPRLGLSLEAGSFGWKRLLAEAGRRLGERDALGIALNLTSTDGWRDDTAYDRQSINLRWDHEAGGGTRFKTLLAYTHIDQDTGANSPLTRDDHLHHPRKNNFGIAFRKVEALRLSTEFTQPLGASELTFTPYLRHNRMVLNGSFNLAFDPRLETSTVDSLGLLTKWRRAFEGAWRPLLIAGFDVERSPGERKEDALELQTSGSGADRSFDDYTVGNRIYDYKVTYRSASAYVHGEASPVSALRLTAGLRYDRIEFDMRNRIDAASTSAGARFYGQAERASADFERVSPKLGATWSLGPRTTLYASWNHGFRTPSEGQLLRAGSAANADDAQARATLALGLEPIKARQAELGLRSDGPGWNLDVALYELVKRDDLVSRRDLASNVTTNVNAGKTRHRGIEIGLGRSLGEQWRLDAAWSYAVHRYADWVSGGEDFSGKEIESAPRTIANTRLAWTPREGTSAQLEWVHVGSWWLEAGNSAAFGKYGGHDVFNLRVRQTVGPDVAVFARVMNLGDKHYADSASVLSNTPVFSPALPRAYYLGLEARW